MTGAQVRRERMGSAPALAVEAAGAPEAARGGGLVLLMHGVGGRASNWRGQLEALGGPDRLAVAWDARGYGDSEDYDGPLAMDDLVADVWRVLDHYGAARAHLVGLSMGGRIALAAYAARPERVASLVLADTSAGHPSASDPEEAARALELRVKPLLEGRSPAETAPAMAARLLGPRASPEARAEAEASLASVHPESYVKTMRCLVRDTAFIAYDRLRVPVLVIHGSEDAVADPAVAERLAGTVPGGRFVRLEGAGHLSNLDAPERFTAAVREFLDAAAVAPRTAAEARA